MSQTFYIHIGMPKTGSSAIQAFLTLNYETLLKRNMYFPTPPKFDQAFQTSSGNAVILYRLFLNNDLVGIKKILDSFGNKENIILSSEALYEILNKYPDRFVEVFKDYNYKIICYVRRQDNLTSSCYNQSIKNHDLKQSVKEVNRDSIAPDFTSTLLNCLNYIDAEKFIIRPYEKQQFFGGNIFADFLHCISLQLDEEFVFPEKVVNPSLDKDTLEFRRILNILEVDRDNIQRKYFINGLLAKYTVESNMGRPFQDQNIFSPQERIEIINSYQERNEQIAKIFLNREDGRLFYDPLPETDITFEDNRKLTLDKTIEICRFLLKTKFDNNENIDDELIKCIAKGTIDRILDQNDQTVQRNNQSNFIAIQKKFGFWYNVKGILKIILNKIKRKNNMQSTFRYDLKNKVLEKGNMIEWFSKKRGKWHFNSVGNDPFFILPGFVNALNSNELFIRIKITVPENTILQVFFKNKFNHFNETRTVTKSVMKGYNDLILHIRSEHPIDALRLDPGTVPGEYIIHQLTVISET